MVSVCARVAVPERAPKKTKIGALHALGPPSKRGARRRLKKPRPRCVHVAGCCVHRVVGFRCGYTPVSPRCLLQNNPRVPLPRPKTNATRGRGVHHGTRVCCVCHVCLCLCVHAWAFVPCVCARANPPASPKTNTGEAVPSPPSPFPHTVQDRQGYPVYGEASHKGGWRWLEPRRAASGARAPPIFALTRVPSSSPRRTAPAAGAAR